MKKKGFVSVFITVFLGFYISLSASEKSLEQLGKDYPHWNLKNKETCQKLQQIDFFIEKHKNTGKLALFDWDGTLYNENISVKEYDNKVFGGQSGWFAWMAFNRDKFKFNVFPMFNSEDGEFIDNVLSYNNFLENKTNEHSGGYGKFVAISFFTAGMTPKQITEGVFSYLKEYLPEKYVFYPMLDVLQRMVDSGYNVWIVTGSNPYFVGSIIKYIENNLYYSNNKRYNFNLSEAPYNQETGHIAGNCLKLMKGGTFSIAYDNRYVKNDSGKLYAVEGEGKLIVAQNLEKKYNKEVIFAAGNSGGDYYDVKYVVNKTDTLSIAVETRGILKELVEKYPEKIIQLESDEI